MVSVSRNIRLLISLMRLIVLSTTTMSRLIGLLLLSVLWRTTRAGLLVQMPTMLSTNAYSGFHRHDIGAINSATSLVIRMFSTYLWRNYVCNLLRTRGQSIAG